MKIKILILGLSLESPEKKTSAKCCCYANTKKIEQPQKKQSHQRGVYQKQEVTYKRVEQKKSFLLSMVKVNKEFMSELNKLNNASKEYSRIKNSILLKTGVPSFDFDMIF